jgi:hypothetical protein
MHRWLVVLVLALVSATAHAGPDKMNLAIGGGIAMGNAPGWAIRLGETIDVSETDGDGVIYGTLSGYDYWRGADGDGFHIPIGGFAGVRAGAVTSTLGLGVGVLALESWHGQNGFGIVPQAAATLGYELDAVHTVVVDARLERHVLAGSDDFTTWSVLLMIGMAVGH